MLDELTNLLRPPESPIDVDEAFLRLNEAAFGIAFPKDFVEYSRIYGSGTIGVTAYSLEVYSAFRPTLPRFVDEFRYCKGEFRKAMQTFDVGLGLFPEPGGLLPFGHRDDHYVAWKTVGESNAWKVFSIWTYDWNGFKAHELTFAEFLVRMLRREIPMPGWRSGWNLETDISFRYEVFGD